MVAGKHGIAPHTFAGPRGIVATNVFMPRPLHSPSHATGHVVIAGALCLSLLVMLPLAAIPAARLAVSPLLALLGL